MMKKIFCFFTLVLVLALTITASTGLANRTDYSNRNCSNGKEYYEKKGLKQYIVENPFISVYIPSEYRTYWRGMPADAETLRITGESVEKYNTLFAENPETLLFADDAVNDRSIMINMSEMGTADFSGLSMGTITRYVNAVFYQQGLNAGDKKDQYIFRTGLNNAYIECIFENDYIGGPYNINAFTVRNHKMIQVMYQSGKPISEAEKDLFDEILNTLVDDPDMYTQLAFVDYPVTLNPLDTEYLDYGDGTFEIPLSLILFDRETKEDDLLLNFMGISMADMKALLDGQKLEFYAYPYDNRFNLTLRLTQLSGESDFIYDNRDYVEQTHKQLVSAYESMGYIVKESSWLDGNLYLSGGRMGKQIWVKDRVYAAGQGAEIIVYMTISKGLQYTFSIASRDLMDSDVDMVDQMITSSELYGG